MDQQTREDLYDLYVDFCTKYQELKSALNRIKPECPQEYERAKAYWLGNIESGIRCEEYIGTNPTFRSFLQDMGIIDNDEEFVVEEDDDE